ncbi:hypothetical protein OIU77_005958 [Salix suchowensis]|uniref:Uncharacterized protein n=1 Tax=Salix suchowensis TaxID=1278906 RepID=A0ABQ9ATX7_9ROSI|nr:hypothetical protein OIU77_005958 [Salix suchowensis]
MPGGNDGRTAQSLSQVLVGENKRRDALFRTVSLVGCRSSNPGFSPLDETTKAVAGILHNFVHTVLLNGILHNFSRDSALSCLQESACGEDGAPPLKSLSGSC